MEKTTSKELNSVRVKEKSMSLERLFDFQLHFSKVRCLLGAKEYVWRKRELEKKLYNL